MKLAAAMKYGGELVDAKNCDYESFKELVPLCPNCKEPVFLRTGGDRISAKGNKYYVGPHWCHFKGVSDEQLASCESRVNGYSEKDKQRIAANARGQRLKLLQRWFWRLVTENYSKLETFAQCSLDSYLADSYLEKDHFYADPMQSYLRKVVKNLSDVSFTQLWENITASKVGKLERFFQDRDSFIEPFGLDKRIGIEVLGFLACPQSSDIFAHLFCAIAYALGDYARMSQYDNEDYFVDSEFDALMLWVFSIPWASEFQRLETEANAKRGT